ncbi:MAG: hypothetical protein AB7D01_05255 [Methanoculleus sp.]
MSEAGPVIAKKVYERLGEREHMSYTVFHERLRKLEFLRLLDLTVRQEKGRTRVIEVREVLAPVSAGSSGAPVNCAAGVCDDEKC